MPFAMPLAPFAILVELKTFKEDIDALLLWKLRGRAL